MGCITIMDDYGCDICILATIGTCDHYGIVRAIASSQPKC